MFAAGETLLLEVKRMIPQRLRCLFRKHRWHNGWDAEAHETVWTCKRCGLIKSEIHGLTEGTAGGSVF